MSNFLLKTFLKFLTLKKFSGIISEIIDEYNNLKKKQLKADLSKCVTKSHWERRCSRDNRKGKSIDEDSRLIFKPEQNYKFDSHLNEKINSLFEPNTIGKDISSDNNALSSIFAEEFQNQINSVQQLEAENTFAEPRALNQNVKEQIKRVALASETANKKVFIFFLILINENMMKLRNLMEKENLN